MDSITAPYMYIVIPTSMYMYMHKIHLSSYKPGLLNLL